MQCNITCRNAQLYESTLTNQRFHLIQQKKEVGDCVTENQITEYKQHQKTTFSLEATSRCCVAVLLNIIYTSALIHHKLCNNNNLNAVAV